MDNKPVTFYCNDLKDTPKERIQGETPNSIYCVHGLTTMKRWIKGCFMKKAIFKISSIISAYNMFMNGVDRFDQMRSTNALERKEMRVSMSIFTFIIDASIHNAWVILNKVENDKHKLLKYRAFKCEISRLLCQGYISTKSIERPLKKAKVIVKEPTQF